jgi:hypothetical protein
VFDIQFDIVTREIVMKDNDFTTTENPSVQNGGILLYSRCTNLGQPMAGIGMEEVIGADMTKTAYELNRWQQMAKDDGATIAKWSAIQLPNNVVGFQTEVSYE